MDEKIDWQGTLVSVQPRIRLTRSFDQRNHSYLGYALRVQGTIDNDEREFTVGIGKAAQAKRLFRAGDIVSGKAQPVADEKTEPVEFYKASGLKVVERAADVIPLPPPWLGVAPELTVYRERGHRRLDAKTYQAKCLGCIWGCWIPLPWCQRVVLAGDHCQLPPTVVSQEAAAAGFGVSLFERLMAQCGPQIARRLGVQYRMHRAIMDFSSREFYESDLEADTAVSEHLLADLPGVVATPLTRSPVEFIDTAGADFDEEVEPDGESRLNRQEADLVCRKVRELLDSGVAAGDIAVIAPYAAQVRLLRERLSVSGLEIDSVDGFQGREKEAVVISLVRSNPKGEIGFLGDVRRMNVAMTRARRKLLVVGDSATLSNHSFYKDMLDYFEGLGAYRTVWEEGELP